MANAVNIVLADAQATPVNHTFVPVGRDLKNPNLYWFWDKSQSNALGYWKISIEIQFPSNAGQAGMRQTADRRFMYKIGLHEPTMETLGTSDSGLQALPTIAYVTRSFTEYYLPERGSLLDRQNIRKMTANLQAHALVTTLVEGLETITG